MNEPAPLTDQEKRIRIATACGWKCIERPVFADGMREMGAIGMVSLTHRFWDANQLPDYFHNLNACHEMKASLTDDVSQILYYGHLRRIITGIYLARPKEDGVGLLDFWIITAKPEHRAEAFGLALSLWEA